MPSIYKNPSAFYSEEDVTTPLTTYTFVARDRPVEPFFDVSPELRDMIWDNVWEHTPVSFLKQLDRCYLYRQTPTTIPTWLVTDKHLYREGVDQVNRDSSWRFHHDPVMTNWNDTLPRTLPGAHSRTYIVKLPGLVLDRKNGGWKFDRPDRVEATMKNVMAERLPDCPLTSLTIVIERGHRIGTTPNQVFSRKADWKVDLSQLKVLRKLYTLRRLYIVLTEEYRPGVTMEPEELWEHYKYDKAGTPINGNDVETSFNAAFCRAAWNIGAKTIRDGHQWHTNLIDYRNQYDEFREQVFTKGASQTGYDSRSKRINWVYTIHHLPEQYIEEY
ncbi:hypothetical protein E8E13_011512 [Curvularia kusanoi]|uniref:Uncharacterized protein n=1 Tax=Curvularia kusanoi TaxID=90978 RepID=A0A9P4WEA1_CURKU|nr:hypothetical protein E8E13_011512 [Curvularia kusanoi]